MGRGPRAQSPVVTRAPPGKQGVESALSLVAPILLSHPSCLCHSPLSPARPARCSMLCSPSVAVWAWVSLLRSSVAGQRVSLLPRPPGDLGAATQDREAQITQAARSAGCALRSRPRSHSRLRGGIATRGGAPGSPPAHMHAHAPRPQASRRQATPALPEASKDRIPSLDDSTPSYPTPASSLSHAPRQSTA